MHVVEPSFCPTSRVLVIKQKKDAMHHHVFFVEEGSLF